MKFQFLPENFSRSENAPPFETRKIRLFEVERIFLKNKKMLDQFFFLHSCRFSIRADQFFRIRIGGMTPEDSLFRAERRYL